jgi:hypothetical protein
MSLLSNAMPWTNDDSGQQQQPKKRVATMRKTVKTKPFIRDSTESSPDAYIPSESATLYKVPTPEDVQNEAEQRNTRVNELINQMCSISEENDGAKLADFRPPPYALNTTSKSETPQITMNWNKTAADEEIEPLQNPLQSPVPKIQAHNDLVYGPSYSNTMKYGSNYQNSYDPTQIVYSATKAAARKTNTMPTDDSRLMEKINYMIRMLENQAVEKTANITEEFILYTFLGVFMIFVLDSFVRVGKYVR